MNKPKFSGPVQILLVEDNHGDVALARDVFANSGLDYRLDAVDDGEKALAYLRRQGAYADAIRPDLILLDLNLPRKDGREVLAEIKADPDLKRIPVVILSTSNSEQDVFRSYNLHANCYIIKPMDLDGFIQVVRSIESFWMNTVVLPPKESD